ncbi:hypothetical protein ES703_54075 [subsurface metagenome]|nr:hypothetical protein [bacterium]
MVVNFGGYRFSEPVKLVKWKPPPSSGVYALLVADSLGASYQVIYFGEAENLAGLSVDEHHPAYPCWLLLAGCKDNLYISAYLTYNWTRARRKALAKKLAARYRPFCNYETR